MHRAYLQVTLPSAVGKLQCMGKIKNNDAFRCSVMFAKELKV